MSWRYAQLIVIDWFHEPGEHCSVTQLYQQCFHFNHDSHVPQIVRTIRMTAIVAIVSIMIPFVDVCNDGRCMASRDNKNSYSLLCSQDEEARSMSCYRERMTCSCHDRLVCAPSSNDHIKTREYILY